MTNDTHGRPIHREANGSGRVGRIVLVAVLTLSWLIAVPYMWKSVTTVPSAARLQEMQSRILHVPSPTTFLRVAAQSLGELAVVAALLWPWWRRFWLGRLLLATLALFLWAVVTMPLEATELEWVHHRWMLGADAILVFGVILSVAGALRRPRTSARTETRRERNEP